MLSIFLWIFFVVLGYMGILCVQYVSFGFINQCPWCIYIPFLETQRWTAHDKITGWQAADQCGKDFESIRHPR